MYKNSDFIYMSYNINLIIKIGFTVQLNVIKLREYTLYIIDSIIKGKYIRRVHVKNRVRGI